MFEIITLCLAALGFGCLGFAAGEFRTQEKEDYRHKFTCTHCHQSVRADDYEEIIKFRAKHHVAHVVIYEWKALYKERCLRLGI